MKKKLCSLLLAAVLLAGMLPVGALAAADWATDAVSTLNSIYGTTVFSADDGTMTAAELNTLMEKTGWQTTVSLNGETLSRGTACEVLADVFDLPVPSGTSAIQYLYEQNIVSGKSPENLAESDPVTKAEFAVLTYRVLNAVGGGMGSSVKALKPGTDEYFAWMYLGARKCVKFEDADKGGNIDEDTWSEWVTALQELPEDAPLTSFTPSYSYADDTVTLLAAAVDIVDAYIEAGGSSTIFSDVPASSPYYDGVTYLFDHGIIIGNGDGTFAPEQTIPRQQLAVLLYRYGASDPVTGEGELPAAMTYAHDKGYLNPVDGSDTAWWQATATCEETIVAIIKACADKDAVLAANTNVLGRFSDANDISTDAAKQYIAYAVSIGILRGSYNSVEGTIALDLSTGATRGQAGVLLYRTLIGLDTSKMHDYEQSVQNALGTDSGSTAPTIGGDE